MQSQFESASGIGGEIASDAKSLGTAAVDRVHSEIDTRKVGAVAQVKSVSSAVESAADNLDPSTPAWLKSALQQGATQIQTLASSLEQKDSRELIGLVTNFARRSPLTFFAACAAAGFGAARILKAGGAASGNVAQPSTLADQNTPAQGRYQPDTIGRTDNFQRDDFSAGQLV